MGEHQNGSKLEGFCELYLKGDGAACEHCQWLQFGACRQLDRYQGFPVSHCLHCLPCAGLIELVSSMVLGAFFIPLVIW